jgi:outer membrane protein assembly factor BamB
MAGWSRRDVVGAVLIGATLAAVLTVAVSTGLFSSRPAPGSLLDLDLATGALNFDVPAETASVHLHALGAGLVVVTGADSCDRADRESLYAYSLPAGTLRWQRSLPGACADFSAPDAVSAGVVAVAVGRTAQGWDAATGRTRWTIPASGDLPRQSATTVVEPDSSRDRLRLVDPANGRVGRSVHAGYQATIWTITPSRIVLAVQSSGGRGFQQRLAGLDARSGRLLWRQAVGGEGGYFAPRTADGVTIAGTAPGAASNAATYTAVDLRDGRRLWRSQRRDVLAEPVGELQAAGAGLALFVHDGTLQALDLRTGALRWTRRLDGWRDGGSSQIVAGAGAVAVVDQERVTVLEARTGAPRWSRPLATGGLRAHAAAAISAGQLLIPSISSAWAPYDE